MNDNFLPTGVYSNWRGFTQRRKRIYIRFSDNIEKDLKRGFSYATDRKTKLNGLCAWSSPFDFDGARYFGDEGEVDFTEIGAYIQNLLNNTYGSYSSNSTAYLVTGRYVGSGNDGVLLRDVEVINSINI